VSTIKGFTPSGIGGSGGGSCVRSGGSGGVGGTGVSVCKSCDTTGGGGGTSLFASLLRCALTDKKHKTVQAIKNIFFMMLVF
jgi:hypothetical protein